MARKSLRPTRAMFLQEKGSSPWKTIAMSHSVLDNDDDVITHVEVDALDSVGLAGPGLAGDDVDEGGDELDGELQHGGEEAAILLGLEAQLAVLSLDAVAEVTARRGPELAGKLLRGVTANRNRFQHKSTTL